MKWNRIHNHKMKKESKTGLYSLENKNKTDCRGAVCFVKRVLGLEIKEIIKDNLYSHYTNPFAKIKQFCK